MNSGVAGMLVGSMACLISIGTGVGLLRLTSQVEDLQARPGGKSDDDRARSGAGNGDSGSTAGERAAAAQIVALKTELSKVTSELNEIRIALGSIPASGGGPVDPEALKKAVIAVNEQLTRERHEADAKRYAEKQMGNALKSVEQMSKGMTLAPEQKAEVEKVLKEQFAKVAKMMSNSDEPGIAIYTQSGIREETEQRVRAVLSQTQQEMFDKMDKSWLPGANPASGRPGKGLVGPGGNNGR
ncbi:MAG: hypothetical protein FD180_675 [Planctomycetota bacterium]|nr:MAG: hypothetical protein FD180_675 [Planctomycetota bacterium]